MANLIKLNEATCEYINIDNIRKICFAGYQTDCEKYTIVVQYSNSDQEIFYFNSQDRFKRVREVLDKFVTYLSYVS